MSKSTAYTTKKLALCGLLASLTLVLGYIESMIPVSPGIPGIKLGLSNGVLIFALYMLDAPTALTLMVIKVVLSGLMFGGVNAMFYSFAGGLLSMLTMILLKKTGISLIIVSMAGGVMHNVGQVAMAMLMLSTPKLMYYMAILMVVGLGMGLVTGVAANATIHHMKNLKGK